MRLTESVYIKASPHCKSPCQISVTTWPGSLVEQLKSSGVDDKPSDFIASSEANQLCYPVPLSGGKRQKKKKRPTSWSQIFLATIFVIHSPLPSQSQDPRIRNIVSSSNIFENFKFSKMLDENAISQIPGSCDRNGRKLDDENRG